MHIIVIDKLYKIPDRKLSSYIAVRRAIIYFNYILYHNEPL
jgi:hypothetical protein